MFKKDLSISIMLIIYSGVALGQRYFFGAPKICDSFCCSVIHLQFKAQGNFVFKVSRSLQCPPEFHNPCQYFREFVQNQHFTHSTASDMNCHSKTYLLLQCTTFVTVFQYINGKYIYIIKYLLMQPLRATFLRFDLLYSIHYSKAIKAHFFENHV